MNLASRIAAFLAGTLLLVSLMQPVAIGGIEDDVPVDPPQLHASTATTALADGDDVRARFLAQADAVCELTAGSPLYVGQNTWATDRKWRCADPMP